MESFLELTRTRRSIRKFLEKDIPVEDIEYFINAAINAPSGCNSQCWSFIAIKDKNKIRDIEEAVIKKVDEIMEIKKNELPPQYLTSKRKMVSFFTKAPVVIAVYMTGVEFYDPIFIDALKKQGYDDSGIMSLFAHYDLLSIGAAVQNMLLAIHEKGYGACWMNEPAIAGEEINKILNVSSDQKFISLVPIGLPAYTPHNKKMKNFNDIFKII